MNTHEPIPHWNNFTIPELKEILLHCRALERVGIAQDEEMLTSIERDIKIRKKKTTNEHRLSFEPKHTTPQPQEYLLEQNVRH